MKLKKMLATVLAAIVCTAPMMYPNTSGTSVTAEASSYSDIPSEYVTACEWVWNNRIYDDENEDWMKDYATIYDQLIAGNGTIQYLIRWDSYQTITLEQRQKLETVLNEALNKWNDCLEGYENWPFSDVTVKIVGWSVLDVNSLQDIQPDEVVYTETMNSTMRDYIIESNMAADASVIPTLEPSEPTDLSRYVHWSDKSWTYNGSYDNRYDMFLEGINGLIDMGGFGWHYGQYLSSNAILGLLDGTTSQHVLLHEMGHGFGFPDYYGGIGDSDGIPPGDFPGGEGSVMEAGRAFQITAFDTWFARYAWSKLSAQEGRFDLSSVSPTEPTTEPTTESVTETTEELTDAKLKTAEFTDTITAVLLNDNGGTVSFSENGTYNFNGTEYYGNDDSKNLSFYENGDIVSIRFTYDTNSNQIVNIESLFVQTNAYKIKGDVNADGAFNVADIILLQKWLLAVPDTHLADWKMADFCKDDKLNVFDLCLMKRELLNSK